MIVKDREDSQRDIEALETLLADPRADAVKRRDIEAQIRNIRAGAAGEADAAYEIKVHFGITPNWVVIHDLRIEHDGLVAQIDHLLINRLLEIWLLESKRISNGVKINEHGEFTTFYNRLPQGMASPIEQNSRHSTILKRLFKADAVQWPTRLGLAIKPQLKSLVLISRGAIQRPQNKIDGLEIVIKTDQLASTINKSLDSGSPFDIAKIIGPATLLEVGQQIARLHRPAQFDWARRFGLAPIEVVAPAIPRPIECVAGLPIARRVAPAAAAPRPAARPKPQCANCSTTVSSGVASFCTANVARFDGRTYCMSCQPGAVSAVLPPAA